MMTPLDPLAARRGRDSWALLTGVFATQVINPDFWRRESGRGSDGHWSQVGNQLVRVLIAWGFAFVANARDTEVVINHRPARNEDQEIEGLDITQHGEEAYNLES